MKIQKIHWIENKNQSVFIFFWFFTDVTPYCACVFVVFFNSPHPKKMRTFIMSILKLTQVCINRVGEFVYMGKKSNSASIIEHWFWHPSKKGVHFFHQKIALALPIPVLLTMMMIVVILMIAQSISNDFRGIFYSF